VYRHLLPRHRRLMREGATAQALVLEARDIQSGTPGHSAWKLRMRAALPGGQMREFWCAVDSHELRGQYATKGDTFPVRYDGDHIDLDLPRIQADLALRTQDIEDRHLAIAEAKFARDHDPHPDGELTPYVRDQLVALKQQLRDGALTEDEVVERVSMLDGQFDGEVTRFLDDAERHERGE
jgi:hypothetical protein